MPEINEKNIVFNKLYKMGFFIILLLPMWTLSPWFMPPDWGKSLIFRSITSILLFLFIWQILYKKNTIRLPNLKKNYVAWIISVYFFIYLLAAIFSVDINFSFWGSPYRGDGFISFLFYLPFLYILLSVSKEKDWQTFFNVSIFTGVLVSLVGIFQYLHIFSKFFVAVADRPPSTMGNPLMLATYLLFLIFISLNFFLTDKNIIKKSLYGGSLLIFFYTLLITGSRAAFLGLAVGIIFFLLSYPKKNRLLKYSAFILIILASLFILYVNISDSFPKFLQSQKLFESVTSRLQLKMVINDPRFASWFGIDINAIKDRPILGWGPENFAVGFDKFYDPSVPYLNRDIAWWDRAHNVLFQTASDAGVFAVLAYLGLFICLFWQLNRVKKNLSHEEKITVISIEACLLAYFTDNLFNIDSFSTYLLFFLVIGWAIFLINKSNGDVVEQTSLQKVFPARSVIMSVLSFLLIFFLWQYNFIPMKINSDVISAQNLVKEKKCDAAFSKIDNALKSNSFLDSYIRMQYVELTIPCNNYYPQNHITYIKNDLKLIGEAVKIQPLYTRYWLLLGNSTVDIASNEPNAEKKQLLLSQAESYLNHALNLSPKHQEIIKGLAILEKARGNYKKMQEYSEKCISLNSDFGDCYFYLALSQIYQKNISDAKATITAAFSKNYNAYSQANLEMLSTAYYSVQDYTDLIICYERLVSGYPKVTQYHSSLAYFYKLAGRYNDARKEALNVINMSPEARQNVEEFLKTLPK